MSEPIQLQCEGCGAVLEVDRDFRTTVCPYCASPSIIDRPLTSDRPAPVYTLCFLVPRERALAVMRRWRRSLRFSFRRADVINEDSLKAMRGVYVPAYLYTAAADSNYSVQIGENYVTGSGKNRRTKTEWFDLNGPRADYLDEILVSASRRVPNEVLEAIEPFDLRALRRYRPELISGWIAEEASRSRDECLQFASEEAKREIGRRFNHFLPGDRQRYFRCSITVRDEEIDLVLVPIWLLCFRHHPKRPPVWLLVNGQTGKTWGKTPLSWWKVGTVALTVAVFVAGVALAITLTGGAS